MIATVAALAYQLEAAGLLSSGLTRYAIAKAMQIDRTTVNHLLSPKLKVPCISEDEIQVLKKEWERLLAQVPNRSRFLARKLSKGLYAKLRRHAYDWLYSERRNGSAPPIHSRIDWRKRDEEWSLRLNDAAAKLKKLKSIGRIAPTTIVKSSGIPSSAAVYLAQNRLPRCRTVIEQNTESLDEYRARRLKMAMRTIVREGLPRKEWVLRQKARLMGKALSPDLTELIRDLLLKS